MGPERDGIFLSTIKLVFSFTVICLLISSASSRRIGGSRWIGSGSSGLSSSSRFGSSAPSGVGYSSGSRFSPSSSSGFGGGTRYGSSLGSGAAVGAGAVGAGALGGAALTRYGSNTYGSSGLGTRYGSGSSTGGIFGSSSGATRYGSSAPSGGGLDSLRNRYTGAGGAARSGFGSRPAINTPSASSSVPSKVVYSPTYNTYNSYGRGGYNRGGGFGGGGFGTGSLIATGLAAGVGGYYLGHVLGSLYSPFGYGYGYGYPGYGGGYVPYRDRYSQYYPGGTNTTVIVNNNIVGGTVTNTSSGTAPVAPGQGAPATAAVAALPQKNVDACMIARWNRELPFAELPNMALEFLANDNISKTTTQEKANFMTEFLTASVDAYANYNSSADIFTMPSGFDVNPCNIKVSKAQLAVNTIVQEEPIMTSLRHVLSLYSNKSSDTDDLRDVVQAAKACLPQGPNIANPEVLPCIDFSVQPDQILKLDPPHSMFGSLDICRAKFSPDLSKCAPKTAGSMCKIEHLATLNLFARNFYLCTDALDGQTVNSLKQATPNPTSNVVVPSINTVSSGGASPPAVRDANSYLNKGLSTTTERPSGFWSKLFDFLG